MALGRGNAANEAAILRTLLTGQTPASMFSIVYVGGPGGKRRTGVGGASTLSRLLNAKLVAYRADQVFASDIDPMVLITDQGIEALRLYSKGEVQGIVRNDR